MTARKTARIFGTILSFCVLSIQGLTADCGNWCSGWFAPGKPCPIEWPSPFDVAVGGGFRSDKFRWSIAGFQDTPNVLSQLEWKELRIAQVGGYANYVSCRNYAIKIAGEYGRIYHGHVLDSDYAGNDRTDLFSLSRSNAGRGHVYDVSAAAGYRVTSNCSRFVATPLVGYSQHQQYLHIFRGEQLFPFQGPIPGLNSRYTTRWYGPWIGLDFEARVERCAFVFGGFEWHMLAYRGHGNWNLRKDLGPFYHKAYGMGYVARLGGRWEIWNRWSIGVMGSYRNFRTRHGHEHGEIFDAFGTFRFTTRFNQAKWRVYTVSGIVAWHF